MTEKEKNQRQYFQFIFGRAREPKEGELEDYLATVDLTEDERKVIALSNGLDGSEPLNLVGVSQIMGITREKARQIREKADSKIIRSSSAWK